MKKLIIFTIVALGTFAGMLNARTIVRADIDVNYFYGSLEPYGEWIDVGYGDFVWRPYNSDSDWRPYAEGRWEWTRHGWYWVSYEPFGWATYHYGRWYYDDYYGWVWMPDTEWGPAWVEWRYDDVYIGWAPLPPYARFNWRSGIYFSISWHSGYHYWNFVKYNHFVSHNIHHHFVHENYVKNIFNTTKYRTNYFADNNRIVNGGINRRFVERKIGRKLNTKIISRTDSYDNFNSRDIKTRNGIVDYRPSERTVKKSTFDRNKVAKGRELSSLKNDKIVLNKRNSEKRNVDLERNNNSKSREIERNKSDRSNKNERGKDLNFRNPVSKRDAAEVNKNSSSRNVTKESNTKSNSREKSSKVEKSKESKPAVREKKTDKGSSTSGSRKSSVNKNTTETKKEVVKKRSRS